MKNDKNSGNTPSGLEGHRGCSAAVSEYLHLRQSEVESLIVYKETLVWPEGGGAGGGVGGGSHLVGKLFKGAT